MKMSTEGKIFLTGLEGICTTFYLDSVGVKTLGIGVTKTEIPNINELPWNTEYSVSDIFKLFDKSLKRYEDAVNNTLKVSIEQHQFDALVSICYNIGTGGLRGSTFMKRINNKDTDKRIGDAIMMWNKPPEIIGRRNKERLLYTTGNYGNGKALLFPVNPNTKKPVYSKGKEIIVRNYLTDN